MKPDANLNFRNCRFYICFVFNYAGSLVAMKVVNRYVDWPLENPVCATSAARR